MSESSKRNSFRHFPADLAVLSGAPILLIATITGSILPIVTSQSKIDAILTLLLAVIGAGLLAWAKLPLYKSGIYFSFGPSAISPAKRIFYYWGMSLVVIGCSATGLILLVQ